mgnify:CR=1 FL=1
MSGATVSEFLAYWRNEGEAYVRCGDYEWMAALEGMRLGLVDNWTRHVRDVRDKHIKLLVGNMPVHHHLI